MPTILRDNMIQRDLIEAARNPAPAVASTVDGDSSTQFLMVNMPGGGEGESGNNTAKKSRIGKDSKLMLYYIENYVRRTNGSMWVQELRTTLMKMTTMMSQ